MLKIIDGIDGSDEEDGLVLPSFPRKWQYGLKKYRSFDKIYIENTKYRIQRRSMKYNDASFRNYRNDFSIKLNDRLTFKIKL